jgi:hypothetical protein
MDFALGEEIVDFSDSGLPDDFVPLGNERGSVCRTAARACRQVKVEERARVGQGAPS